MQNFATPENIDDYKKAGRVAAEALDYGMSLIKPGASMREVLDKVETFIHEKGCEPAFPAQSCTNQIAAHFCPREEDDITYKEGDLVKLDVGVHSNGFIGDNARSVSLGGKHQELCDAAKAAVEAVEKMLKAGVTPDQIGSVIQDTLHAKGCRPIRNLTGHGVGQYMVHTKPSIPNYPAGDHAPLEENQVIAVEPFATDGKEGLIYNSTNPTIFSLEKERPLRTQYGRDAYNIVKKYNGLPFTTRWLTKELGGKALLGLNEMRRTGMLTEYPPLPEKSNGLVAQHEHTFLIKKDGCARLTHS